MLLFHFQMVWFGFSHTSAVVLRVVQCGEWQEVDIPSHHEIRLVIYDTLSNADSADFLYTHCSSNFLNYWYNTWKLTQM